MDKSLFAIGAVALAFILFEGSEKCKSDKKLRQLSGSSSRHSRTKRNEDAVVRSIYGINPDFLLTKDLTIYPKKGGNMNKSTLSKAIDSVSIGEDEFYYQNERMKHNLQPSAGVFLNRESVIESDMVVSRQVRIPDAADVHYEQTLLARNRRVKAPMVKRHDYVPQYNWTRSAYFDTYDSHDVTIKNTNWYKLLTNIFNK